MIALLLIAELIAPARPALDQLALAKLRAGIVFSESSDEGESAGSVLARAIIKSPPAAVFAVLTNHARFAEFMPRIEKVEVSRRTDSGERVLQTVDATISTVRYALDYQWSAAALRLEFALAPGVPADIKAAAGSWQLWELDGGKSALLEYRVRADIGRAVPGFIKDFLQSRGAKDAVEAIKKRTESGEVWKKG